MNTIFIKEVIDTAIRGKLLKLNHNRISNDEYVIEINISNKIINEIKKDSAKFKSASKKIFKVFDNIFNSMLLSRFKNKLNKILLSYSNVDLCILSITDLGRSMTDLLNIMKLCNEKNIRIFNFERNQFFDIKMFLVFADEQQKIISKQMEQSL